MTKIKGLDAGPSTSSGQALKARSTRATHPIEFFSSLYKRREIIIAIPTGKSVCLGADMGTLPLARSRGSRSERSNPKRP
jgi:hypothetical protein